MIPRYVAMLSALALLPLVLWDASPASFPGRAHDVLSAVPLALVGVACLLHPVVRGARRGEIARAGLAAAAFFAWAANQFWPEHPAATLMNDAAVTLFVVDVLLTILAAAPASS